jgi:hypothetical protein
MAVSHIQDTIIGVNVKGNPPQYEIAHDYEGYQCDKYYTPLASETRDEEEEESTLFGNMFFIRLPTAKAKRRSCHGQAEAKSK